MCKNYTFLVKTRSGNWFRTRDKPFMNWDFSSLVFSGKLSRYFMVDTNILSKYFELWNSIVVIRIDGWRTINRRSTSVIEASLQIMNATCYHFDYLPTLKVNRDIVVSHRWKALYTPLIFSHIVEGTKQWFTLVMHRVGKASKWKCIIGYRYIVVQYKLRCYNIQLSKMITIANRIQPQVYKFTGIVKIHLTRFRHILAVVVKGFGWSIWIVQEYAESKPIINVDCR